jgi:hypothetical protein
LELVRPQTGWTENDVALLSTGRNRILDSRFNEATEKWLRSHAGERSDRKVSLLKYDVDPMVSQKIQVRVDETEWAIVQPMHLLLQSREGVSLRDEFLSQIIDGSEYPVPNIACIHGVVVTSDDLLIASKRSPSARYHPSSWSVSFEEQIEPKDLVFGNAGFHEAAARGVREEFLSDPLSDSSSNVLVSLIVEVEILNPAMIAIVRVKDDSLAILRKQRELADRDAAELDALQFIPYELGALSQLVLSPCFKPGLDCSSMDPWHPTSRYRLLMVMLHRFGVKASITALRRRGGLVS